MREIAIETLEAYGHRNIRATHRSTFELTKDDYLTHRGDCIIGIKASKSVAELSKEFKDVVRRSSSILIIVLEVDDVRDIVIARGSKELQLTDNRRIVVRRSRFIGPDTLAIEANKAARDISRELIEKLRDSNAMLRVKLVAIDLKNRVGELIPW